MSGSRRQTNIAESPLVEHALLSIGSGSCHISDAYDFVAKAEQSGCSDKHVLSFLRLGTHGKFSSNLERDLFASYLGKQGVHVEPYSLELQLQMPDRKHPEMVQIVARPAVFLYSMTAS
jgi:hypothetical protein